MPADVEIGCPGGPTFPAAALGAIPPPAASDLDEEIETAIREFLDNEEGQVLAAGQLEDLHQTDNSVLLMHLEGSDVWNEETGFAS